MGGGELMALTFPRDMTALCKWRQPRLTLIHRQELSRAANGVPQAKDLGDPLWQADFRSVPLPLATADAVMAEFQSLRGAVHPFYLYDPIRRAPFLSSSGALSGATVTVQAIAAENDAITLQGLPLGLSLTSGDRLTVTTATGAKAHLQLVRGGTTNGAGISPSLAVTPHVPVGVAVDDAVALIDPPLKMRLEPGTLDDPFVSLTHREITFRAMQDPS